MFFDLCYLLFFTDSLISSLLSSVFLPLLSFVLHWFPNFFSNYLELSVYFIANSCDSPRVQVITRTWVVGNSNRCINELVYCYVSFFFFFETCISTEILSIEEMKYSSQNFEPFNFDLLLKIRFFPHILLFQLCDWKPPTGQWVLICAESENCSVNPNVNSKSSLCSSKGCQSITRVPSWICVFVHPKTVAAFPYPTKLAMQCLSTDHNLAVKFHHRGVSRTKNFTSKGSTEMARIMKLSSDLVFWRFCTTIPNTFGNEVYWRTDMNISITRSSMAFSRILRYISSNIVSRIDRSVSWSGGDLYYQKLYKHIWHIPSFQLFQLI